MRSGLQSVAAVLGWAGLGVVLGAAATLTHHIGWFLILGAAASLATSLAAPAGWGRIGFTVGWLAPVIAFMIPRPEGDYLIAADVRGFALLGLAMVLMTTATVTIPRRSPRSGPRDLTAGESPSAPRAV